MVQDSPLLCDQIKSLTSSINMLQRRLIKSEGRTMKTRVNNLPPIQKFVEISVRSIVMRPTRLWMILDHPLWNRIRIKLLKSWHKIIFRIDLEDRNCFVDIAEKIEQNTAPILRPSKLIKVGQPQPSILLLASKIHEKVFNRTCTIWAVFIKYFRQSALNVYPS